MNELFNLSDSKSPRQKWIEQHRLLVAERTTPAAGQTRFFCQAAGNAIIGNGETADDAIVQWAIRNNVRLWNEQNFRR